ncbi:MAG: S8 family serine peptidase [Phycisphaerales bacterium]|nr:S8 family serine peptidase [Phycisphaerales bacterium]
MPTASRTRCQRLSVALVLALASGAAMAAGGLSVSKSRGGSILSLGGTTFHQTSAAVLNPRIVQLPGGAVAALWTERAADGSLRPMYGIALNGSTFDIVRPAEYGISMYYAQFDPLQHVPEVPANLSAGAGNELYIVQYVVPPYQAMSEAVAAAGGTVERYLPQLAQVVRMSPEAVQQVSALPFVRWVGVYHPAYRVSPAVFQTLESAGDAPARYSIETMRSGPAQQDALSALVAQMGGQVNVVTPDQYRMEATLSPSQLLQLIQRNEVNFVDPWGGPGGTDMNIIRQQGGAVPLLSGLGYTGQGVRGEVFDTEVFATHQQWNGQQPMLHKANGNSGTHGSSCYGINFATGTGNVLATGMLPDREQGIFCWYPNSTQFGGGFTRLSLNTEATDPNGGFLSVFQTSSVGSSLTTQYTTLSAETDDYLFRVDYLSCQSQSNANSTSSRPQAWAKNIVSVGGMETHETAAFADDTTSGASFGPAQDTRVKPDLCNSYSGIFTTTAGVASYTQFGGTSGATPITAGHFGLLMQMWHGGVWAGFGGGSSVFSDRPQSATAKALMINQAHQYNWPGGGANAGLTRARQGWGVAHVGNLYNIRAKTFIINGTDVLTALQSKQYNLTVAAGEPEFKVTMVYKDPQGNPASTSQHRVNNVDLKVTSPGGIVYWGNNGMTGSLTTVAGGAANTKDTVENVFVNNPQAGTWKVEVIAAEVVQDGYLATAGVNDVAYGLVATGVTTAPCYPDCNGDGALNLADFGCFQTKFALGDAYADCNGDGLRDLADFGCFTTKFALGCP